MAARQQTTVPVVHPHRGRRRFPFPNEQLFSVKKSRLTNLAALDKSTRNRRRRDMHAIAIPSMETAAAQDEVIGKGRFPDNDSINRAYRMHDS